MTGSGTQADPYIISSKTDLQNIENDLTAYYELGDDIDASGTGAGFTPITDFTGQLDGKDYTITGFFISRTGSTNQALFGEISGSAVVKNVTMTGVDITSDRHYAAALVATLSAGTITNCSSTGTIENTWSSGLDVGGLIGLLTSGTVSQCWSSCTITNVGDYSGGLIGRMNDGDIDECYAIGDVTADDYGGGFVGYVTAGTINDCYARGDVTVADDYTGGFAGYSRSGVTIEDCYSTGAVAGSGSYEGGFCGYDNSTITTSYWDTATSGTETDPGGGSGGATGKTTAQMKTQATFTDAGWDFATIWCILATTNEGYPSFAIGATSSEGAGVIAIVEERLHYVDAYGDERWIEGTKA